MIGVDLTPGGAPCAILARQGEDGLEYVGNAFLTLPSALRDAFWLYVEQRAADQPAITGIRKKGLLTRTPAASLTAVMQPDLRPR